MSTSIVPRPKFPRQAKLLLPTLILSLIPNGRASQPAQTPPPPAAQSDTTLERNYLQIYTGLCESEKKEKAGDLRGALAGYEDCYTKIHQIRFAHPEWESVLIASRMQDLRAKFATLEQKLPAAAPFTSPGPPGPDSSPVKEYPWKSGIHTEVFQLPQGSPTDTPLTISYASWTPSTRGTKLPSPPPPRYDPVHGYGAPFYVSLPFNDLKFPVEAHHWLPANWVPVPTDNGQPTISTCQNRWVALKSNAGRICYAQWEAVGPDGDNDPAYVFGNAKPKNGHAGIGISAAVAKFLEDDQTVVSWHFVDNGSVPPGMWLRYDEQRILFRALHSLAD